MEIYNINEDQIADLGMVILQLSELTNLTFTIQLRGQDKLRRPMICIDRTDCFDKCSKCPIILDLPNSFEQASWIIKIVKEWLLTDEGYKDSCEYNTNTWINCYPDEIRERG